MMPSLTSEKAKTVRSCAIAMSAVADEARAAAERVPVHDRDHRGGAGVDCFEHAPERVGVRDVLVVGETCRLPHPFDVSSRAEAGAFAGQHDCARLADVDERFGELLDQRCVESVPKLRSGEGDTKDVVVPFDPQRVHREAV